MLSKLRDNYLIFTVLELSNCLIVCSAYMGFPLSKAGIRLIDLLKMCWSVGDSQYFPIMSRTAECQWFTVLPCHVSCWKGRNGKMYFLNTLECVSWHIRKKMIMQYSMKQSVWYVFQIFKLLKINPTNLG